MRHLFASTLAVLAVSANAFAESTQCTPITIVPYTVTAPGNYCLTGDLGNIPSSVAIAITIASDNVLIDLNGHTLSGAGPANNGVGIYSLARVGLTIRNGSLRNFGTAVLLSDTLSGFPATNISGTSQRHEVAQLRIDNSVSGIEVFGHLSSIHDNIVTNSSAFGIYTGSSYIAGKTGAINISNNQVLNTIAPAGTNNNVFGISAGGTGSVIENNLVSTVHGGTYSGGIYAAGLEMILSGNRESDIGGYAVSCPSGGAPAKVKSNISFVSTASSGNLISGCSQPTGYAADNY